jgi:hypothetical protein
LLLVERHFVAARQRAVFLLDVLHACPIAGIASLGRPGLAAIGRTTGRPGRLAGAAFAAPTIRAPDSVDAWASCAT